MSKYQITETSASKWQLYFRDQRNDFVADKFNGKLVQTMGICQKGVYTVSLEEGIYLLELDRASIINKEEFNLKFIDLMKHNRVNLSKIKVFFMFFLQLIINLD